MQQIMQMQTELQEQMQKTIVSHIQMQTEMFSDADYKVDEDDKK